MQEARRPGLLELFFVSRRRPPALVAAQADQRLRFLVRHAYEHIPFYREHWRSAGFHPRDFRDHTDLPRIPPVDKELLVEAGDAVLDPRVPRQRFNLMTTSGTSGRAIRIARTISELRVTRRAILRTFVHAGLRPWHRVVTVASPWLHTRKGMVMNAIAKVRHLFPLLPLDEQIATLDRFQPLGVIGQTGGIYLLARELLRRGRTLPMRAVLPTGATLMDEMRQTIALAFAVEPRDMYGAIEVGPISMQCSHGNYHIDADRLAVEIVAPDGRPVPPGVPGQVVCTALHAHAMPFIRYRLLDIAALRTDTCGCGVRFPLMTAVQGRINDFLPTPNGELVSPHFFFHLFDHAERNPVRNWRLTQHSRVHLSYEYEPESGACPEEFERGMTLIRQRFGPACRLDVQAVPHIPLTEAGKRRCIISKLRPTHAGLERAWIEGATSGSGNGQATVVNGANPAEIGA